MDSELLLKFIGYFPDYLSALSRRLLGFFWTTLVETAVYSMDVIYVPQRRGYPLQMVMKFSQLDYKRPTINSPLGKSAAGSASSFLSPWAC